MDKPLIKFDINRNLPRQNWKHPEGSVLINAFYRYDGKQWNAPVFLGRFDYVITARRNRAISRACDELHKRFAKELNA